MVVDPVVKVYGALLLVIIVTADGMGMKTEVTIILICKTNFYSPTNNEYAAVNHRFTIVTIICHNGRFLVVVLKSSGYTSPRSIQR